jgi:aspartyl-tRNA(Asn)/glutamyl-tRNA(Gln) amidotransferase subunit A
MDPEVTEKVQNAIKVLEGLGAVCEEVSLPYTDYGIADYQIISRAEASANLARFDGVRYGYRAESGESLIDMYRKTRSEGFGDEVKLRIMLGTYALSSGYYDAYYLKAQKVRTLIKDDFDKAFGKFDVIVTPTSPTPAFKIGEKMDDPLTMYLSDIFTVNCNMAGIPGMSMPCGFSSDGLPIGLQILAKPFDEETIFRVAYTFEQNTEHHQRKPEL